MLVNQVVNDSLAVQDLVGRQQVLQRCFQLIPINQSLCEKMFLKKC